MSPCSRINRLHQESGRGQGARGRRSLAHSAVLNTISLHTFINAKEREASESLRGEKTVLLTFRQLLKSTKFETERAGLVINPKKPKPKS